MEAKKTGSIDENYLIYGRAQANSFSGEIINIE